MSVKGYPTFPKALALLEPHHQIVLCHFLGGVLQLCKDAVSIFAAPADRAKVKLVNIVEGDPKAPFSLATTLKFRGGRYCFLRLLHFTLDQYLIRVSGKQVSIKYHFLSLRYDSIWSWTPVSGTYGKHSTHLTNGQQRKNVLVRHNLETNQNLKFKDSKMLICIIHNLHIELKCLTLYTMYI